MPSCSALWISICVVLLFCLPQNGVYAFGAGNIPNYAYMEGKAFRHGDIEQTLADIAKKAGGGILGGMMASKFSGLDIKRIYFGNWLRDYSQAVDIGGLKKLPLQTIINLCMVLGFVAHGYATEEFEVTEERLGVYLPTEHIDNPKGYGEGEDARKYHPKLRGPVNPRELDIDPRTGMKNYIANESQGWDTSKSLVRRTFERCIHIGRQYRRSNDKRDLYEAYRLLGQALHTLEDFTAHSNFCELALISMGHQHIFTHVGDHVRIKAPNGRMVAPIVTGTFGSSDFIHSLLGEAADHISQASIEDLNKEIDSANQRARSGGDGNLSVLRELLSKMPSSSGDRNINNKLADVERIRAAPAQGGRRPEDLSPQELHTVLWQILSFRDSVMKKIEETIENIPGLAPLLEKISTSITVFVFTTLEPFIKPLMKAATSTLTAASGEVIDTQDQFEVFNSPRASDPTHSFLSKDHFNLILNEPAGKVAKVIVAYTVKQIVKAWGDDSVNVHYALEDILQCLFHPDFHNPNSAIQRDMLQTMREWVQSLGHKQYEILSRLSKESIRQHNNVHAHGDGGQSTAVGTFAYNAGHEANQEVNNEVGGIMGNISSAFAGLTGGNAAKTGLQNVLGRADSGQSGAYGYDVGVSQYQSKPGSMSANFPGAPPFYNPPPGPPSGRMSGEATAYYSEQPSYKSSYDSERYEHTRHDSRTYEIPAPETSYNTEYDRHGRHSPHYYEQSTSRTEHRRHGRHSPHYYEASDSEAQHHRHGRRSPQGLERSSFEASYNSNRSYNSHFSEAPSYAAPPGPPVSTGYTPSYDLPRRSDFSEMPYEGRTVYQEESTYTETSPYPGPGGFPMPDAMGGRYTASEFSEPNAYAPPPGPPYESSYRSGGNNYTQGW